MPLFHKYSLKQINDQIVSGVISPRDLACETIRLIEKYNPKLHAFVSFVPEKLENSARLSTARLEAGHPAGILEGVPIGVKDVMNTCEYPTQMGSELWKGFTPGNDARVVFNCFKHGAVLAGKTETAEFAVHALNNTINPYDPKLNPGTSSSGSAVAVATSIVPAALATQTAGSIVRPASYCGVYGCKPSFGLIPRTGVLKTTDSLDTIGFFVNHAEDLGLMFDVLRVHGPDYPYSHAALRDASRQRKPETRPWRIALLKTYTWSYAEQYAQAALEGFVNRLSDLPGFEVIEVELPDRLNESHHIHETIYNAALSHYFQDEYNDASMISPVMESLIEKGLEISAQQYRDALVRQAELVDIMDKFWTDYDVGISLATSGVAPMREATEKPDPALIWTLAHLPVVCAPAFEGPGSLPFGVQIIARKYNDYKLFAFVAELCAAHMLPEKSMLAY